MDDDVKVLERIYDRFNARDIGRADRAAASRTSAAST